MSRRRGRRGGASSRSGWATRTRRALLTSWRLWPGPQPTQALTAILVHGDARVQESIARWYGRRFGVELQPHEELQPLVGSKEGIFHLPVAFIDPGDVALIPDPGYPVYETGTILSHGEAVLMPLLPSNDFKPDLGALADDVVAAKVLWLNYPRTPPLRRSTRASSRKPSPSLSAQ